MRFFLQSFALALTGSLLLMDRQQIAFFSGTGTGFIAVFMLRKRSGQGRHDKHLPAVVTFHFAIHIHHYTPPRIVLPYSLYTAALT